MKTWSYGINSLPQFKSGNIQLIEQPAWLAAADWIVDKVLGQGCCLFHWISLPKWLYITDKNDGQKYSLFEWYGDLGQLWHLYIFCPCFYWVEGHPKRIQYTVKAGYDEVKSVFYNKDKAFFDDHETDIAEILAEDKNEI